MMKKMVFFTVLCVFLSGCNRNPSKEARIQKLEIEIAQSLDKIKELESRIQTLEGENVKLKTRILGIEGE